MDEDPRGRYGAGGAAGQGGGGHQAVPAGPGLHTPQRSLQVRVRDHQEALAQHHRSLLHTHPMDEELERYKTLNVVFTGTQ